tara:strand:- start:201 stop:1457 length:1257 start_codon:yes stop_codon:yes gene_type:complete
MSTYSPLGTEWLEWHTQRIFNFSEYFRINGFFSNYAFSIWSSCNDCSLLKENWTDKIYLSQNLFSHFQYVLFNYFFGEINFKLYGNIIGKLVIFLTGILIAELSIIFSNKNLNFFHINPKSLLIFTFFIINPWTYKMILADWTHIYFLMFFLLGILMFNYNKQKLGLLFFLIASFFDYQSSAGLFMFYIFILIFSKIKKNKNLVSIYYPRITNYKFFELKILVSLLLPIIIFFVLKQLALEDLNNLNSGSSLLRRIGISGNDINNGGILGALQFLGGNRITLCLINFSGDLSSMSLDTKIEIFNCTLSILSMFVVSIISLFGLFIIYKDEKKIFNLIIFPLLFVLLSFVFILQQSSSVHLMGYSYFFSILFSLGITNLLFKIIKKSKYSFVTNVIALPIILGILILCIRVSMLTGPNG